MNIQDKIDVLVAFRDGKKVEGRKVYTPLDNFCVAIETAWEELPLNPNFNFGTHEYRIKKEPYTIYFIKSSLGYGLYTDSPYTTDTILKKFIEVID